MSIGSKNILEMDFAKTAAQVSHDIKSPLAALDMLICNIKEFPEDQRILARNAIGRIKDIANDLLQKNRAIMKSDLFMHNNKSLDQLCEPLTNQLLSSLLEEIVSEKRWEVKNNPDIDISFTTSINSYGIFANVQPVEFKRMISNLLNNGIESLDGEGKVEITIQLLGSEIVLRIIDNGKGMSSKTLKKVGKRGETQGKHDGCGLGLYHARQSCESFGGTLHIESALNVGTEVVIRLPKANPPKWFVPDIKLTTNSVVLILDYDCSIKEMWHQRFNEIKKSFPEIKIVCFSETSELERYLDEFGDISKFMCLVDYEFIDISKSGLDVIEKLGLCSKSILVTSHWDEHMIQSRCAMQGVGLIPKGLAGIVPITIQ